MKDPPTPAVKLLSLLLSQKPYSNGSKVIDNGPPSTAHTPNSQTGSSKSDKKATKAGYSTSSESGSSSRGPRKVSTRPPPFRPHPACAKTKGLHWIDDCDKSSDEQKFALKAEIRAKLTTRKAAHGPSKSTRSQKARANRARKATLARLQLSVDTKDWRRFITVSDGTTSLYPTGRCDDGSEDSIVSSKLAEAEAVKGICNIVAIQKVTSVVALEKYTKDAPKRFSFSRT